MPGIVGAIATGAADGQLEGEFLKLWPTGQIVHHGSGFIGGHAFPPHRSVFEVEPGVHLAVDGEAAVYALASRAKGGGNTLFVRRAESLELSADSFGNLAVVDDNTRKVYLASEWTGSFPLYYWHRSGGFFFSTHLHLLANVFPVGPDGVGVLTYAREGFVCGARSLVSGIRRLMPGQSLVFDITRGRVDIRENSLLWAGLDRPTGSHSSLADDCWDALLGEVSRSMGVQGQHGVMLSGGWDSRTLLAAACERVGPDRIQTYHHGDLRSREAEIAESVSRECGTRFVAAPIDSECFRLENIQEDFRRTGLALFPYWHRAGARLSAAGVRCVSGGVYGEVLGGHYGPGMILQGWKKAMAVAKSIMGLPFGEGPVGEESLQRVLEWLVPKDLSKPWYLSKDYWDSIGDARNCLALDARADLDRLVERGADSVGQLIEAFVSEHRGSQYINSQLTNCRAYVDVAIPFAGQRLLLMASRLPLAVKIHNRLNQEMLRRHARGLLNYPMAATLVNASAPLTVQEGSRFARRLLDTVRAAVGSLLPAMAYRKPSRSWVNFEWLRESIALDEIAADLRMPVWDRRGILAKLGEFKSSRHDVSMHSVADQLLKLYTIELTFRKPN